MAKYIYILFFILLKVAYINAANKIVISDSSKLKGVSITSYQFAGGNLNTFDVLNIANPTSENIIGFGENVSWNDLDDFQIDQGGLYLNNEIIGNYNTAEKRAIYGKLNNYADTIVINIKLPSTANINGALTVLGKKANLILLNANGSINCNSCSFGNVNGLDFTANSINIDQFNNVESSINSFRTQTNNLTVNNSTISANFIILQSNNDINISNTKLLPNAFFTARAGALFNANYVEYRTQPWSIPLGAFSFSANEINMQNNFLIMPQANISINSTQNTNITNSYIQANAVNIDAKALFFINGDVAVDRLQTKTILNTVIDNTVFDLSKEVIFESESFVLFFLNIKNINSSNKPKLYITSNQSDVILAVRDPILENMQAYRYFSLVSIEAKHKIHNQNNIIFNKNYITTPGTIALETDNKWFFKYQY